MQDRVSRLTIVTVLIVVAVPLILIVAGSIGSPSAAPANSIPVPKRIAANATMGFCIEVVDTWETLVQSDQVQTSPGSCTSEKLRAELIGTAPILFSSRYKQSGADAQDQAGCHGTDRRYVSFSLVESGSAKISPINRPQQFGPDDGSGIDTGFDDQECGERGQVIRFITNGRALEATIGFGPDADPRRVEQIYLLLDSLYVNPAS